MMWYGSIGVEDRAYSCEIDKTIIWVRYREFWGAETRLVHAITIITEMWTNKPVEELANDIYEMVRELKGRVMKND